MRAIRFFRVLPLHSTYMLAGLAALGVFGIVTLSLDPTRGMDAAIPVLLLHMFAVSSGFALPARRGHFDLLLTTGSTRVQVALVHWVVSIAPGVAVWLLLGAVEWMLAGHPRALLSNGTVAAVLLISVVGWALTVPLPRLSGGVIWLVALFIVLAASGDWRGALLDAAERGGGHWELGIVFVLCPLLLVGTRLEPPQLVALVPGLLTGIVALVVAIAWINRVDVTLEASQ